MACLVEAVYMLEEQNHGDGLLLASEVDTDTTTWWTRFNYKLDEMLFDISESGRRTIFGAVYRRSHGHAPTGPPNIVIAFRGTMMRWADWKANLMIYLGRLESHQRFTAGLKAVERAVEEVGWGRVCVTGHSKGAAIGLLVGRAMAEKGKLIEAHLFNPPHPTVRNGRPFGWVPVLGLPNWFAGTVEFLHEVISRTLSSMTQDAEAVEEERQRFRSLRPWCPSLYIHTQDPISSTYISYFGAARNVSPPFRRIMTMPYSIRQSFLSTVGVDSKPHHLIPCAKLIINKKGIIEAHTLKQWYNIQPSDMEAVEACRIHVDGNNSELNSMPTDYMLIVFGCLCMCALARSCIN